MTRPGDAFWSRSVDDILAEPRDVLKDHVVHYYESIRDEELDQIRKLKAATNHAGDLVDQLETDLIKERLDNLEEHTSPSFFEVALGLGLAGVGGAIAAAALQKVLGRLLRSRLLLVTTVSKVRLPMEAASPARLKKLRALSKQHRRELETREHFYKLTGPAKEINLDPDSWESVLLNHLPDLLGGALAGAAVESQTRPKRTYERTVDFFADRKSDIDGQILPVQKTYHDLLLSMSAALSDSANTQPHADARRAIVATIHDNRSFAVDGIPVTDQFNLVQALADQIDRARGATLRREDEMRVLAQPIFTAGVAMSYFIPMEILEATPSITTSLRDPDLAISNRTVVTIPALPRRPKANSAENRLLVRLAKVLFVPSEFGAGRLVTMFDEYQHQPMRPQLEVVKYFNEVRLKQFAPSWKSIRGYIRSVVGADDKER